jgi:PAS domain S-box-containing protein
VIASRTERRLLVAFSAALLLTAASVAYTWRAGTDISQSLERLERSQSLRQAARHLHAAVASAEAAQRTFLLTGGAAFRAAYERHASEARELQAKLGELVGSAPAAAQGFGELQPLVTKKLAELAQQLEAPASAPMPPAGSPALLESIRVASENIAAAEEAWLAQRARTVVRNRVYTLSGFVLAMAAATAVLVVLFRGARAAHRARVAADRALREANQFLDSIVENIPDMIFVKDARTLRFVRINRAGEALIGRPRDELIGKTDRDFLPHDLADFYNAKDREVIATGEVLDIPEERLETAHGGERILHTKKIPLRDENGDSRYVLGISEDVTERSRQAAEIRALNAALARRAAEIESVNKELETFAYSVSHDLRAPLRHIGGYAQLLTQALEHRLEEEPRRYLNVITQATRQMGELIEDLLSFSRMTRTDMNRARVAPREVVDAVIAGLEMETRGRDIEWRIGELPPIMGDPAMLKIVYANLIGNAVKYTAPRERAVIEIGAEAPVDGRVVLFVRDNGVGFDMAYADRLFGIFQRLHPAGEFEGTGIGLATVQRIIARHGGRVWAKAAPGEGAAFYFTLAEPAQSERREE